MKISSMKILTMCSLVIIVLIFTYSNVHAVNVNTVTYTCQTDSPYGWTCEDSGYASPGDTCWCFGPPPAYGHVIRSS